MEDLGEECFRGVKLGRLRRGELCENTISQRSGSQRIKHLTNGPNFPASKDTSLNQF